MDIQTPQPAKRTFKGVVVSDKMDKTLVVRVDTIKTHERYKKRYTTSQRYFVHDEKKEYHIGDVVTFQETRPLSRHKRWRVTGRVTI